MEKVTEKQIEEACKELQEALSESIKLDEQTVNLEAKKRKARTRLLLARDVIRNLKIN